MGKKRVIIIGGGASGLIAAVFAAENGASVTVLEHTENIGKKLLSTGNGRCNYTNSNIKNAADAREYYHSFSDNTLPEKVFENFGYEDTLEFFRRIGIEPKFRKYAYDSGSYVYPMSDQASSVLRALKQQADTCNVRFITSCNISGVAHINNLKGTGSTFSVYTENDSYRADALIICTGAKAAPATGSDGSGFDFPCCFGHTMWEFLPSLCALKCSGGFFRELKGVRCDSRIKLYISEASKSDENDEETRLAVHNGSGADNFGFITDDKISSYYERFGEVQFTDYGISGIPVFQLSRYAAVGEKLGRKMCAELDLLPDFTEEELRELLLIRRDRLADRTAEYFFNGLINEKLSRVILKKAEFKGFEGVYSFSEDDVYKFARLLKNFSVEVTETKGFENAQCCAGGVDASEINPDTMESEMISDLYFAGEIIDVDGDCGGYNLQWAWSTGAIAGRSAAKYHDKKNYPEIFPNNVMK